jgi:DNA-binding beta-propeller fold protein YncE
MPRSVAVDAENGDIYVVDSGNSRVHRYTSSGIRVVTFGCRGTIQPDPSATAVEFRQPSSVVVPAFGSTIVVADREDRRIQVFTKDMTSPYHERLRTFNTVNEPHSLAFDELREQILVGTTLATVEIYDKFTSSDVTLVHQFSVHAEGTVTAREHRSKKTSLCPVQIAVTNTKPQTVLVLDQVLGVVSYYTYDGRLIYHFNPSHDRATYDLAFTPAGLAVDQIGQIIISDGLNQAVGLFDDRGRLVRYVVDPGARDAGPVQAVTVGPEGHFVCTEYSLNGPHCVKVWKYRECPCHGGNTPAKSRKSR